MRNYVVPAAIAALLASAPAAAQDRSESSPFEGLYAGVNGGVAWSDSHASWTLTQNPGAPAVNPPIVTPLNTSTDFDSKHHTGFTGGLEGGYNWVGYHGLLIGFETDFDIFDITGSRTNTVSSTTPSATYTAMQKVDTNWLWTIRPRIGYAGGSFAAYATGGIAWADTKYDAVFTDSSNSANNIALERNKTKTGWTAGAGAAYAFGRISVKGEYLFQHFGHDNLNTTSASGFYTLDANANLKSHIFRVGVDYSF